MKIYFAGTAGIREREEMAKNHEAQAIVVLEHTK